MLAGTNMRSRAELRPHLPGDRARLRAGQGCDQIATVRPADDPARGGTKIRPAVQLRDARHEHLAAPYRDHSPWQSPLARQRQNREHAAWWEPLRAPPGC
jgi:hypothetical protein